MDWLLQYVSASAARKYLLSKVEDYERPSLAHLVSGAVQDPLDARGVSLRIKAPASAPVGDALEFLVDKGVVSGDSSRYVLKSRFRGRQPLALYRRSDVGFRERVDAVAAEAGFVDFEEVRPSLFHGTPSSGEVMKSSLKKKYSFAKRYGMASDNHRFIEVARVPPRVWGVEELYLWLPRTLHEHFSYRDASRFYDGFKKLREELLATDSFVA